MNASEWNLDEESCEPKSTQFVYPFAQVARETQVKSSRFHSHQGSKAETEHQIGEPVETGILLITLITCIRSKLLFVFLCNILSPGL